LAANLPTHVILSLNDSIWESGKSTQKTQFVNDTHYTSVVTS
jgi:hypothetical protein